MAFSTCVFIRPLTPFLSLDLCCRLKRTQSGSHNWISMGFLTRSSKKRKNQTVAAFPLGRLPVECLSMVAEYLPAAHLSRLLRTGDKVFLSKLTASVTKVDVDFGPALEWPFFVFSFQKLRSLRLIFPHLMPFFRLPKGITDFFPHGGLPSLDSLEIQLPSAFDTLNRHPSQPPLSSIFPALRVLKVTGTGTITKDTLSNLPNSLVELDLKIIGFRHPVEASALDVTDLSFLPQSLESLTLCPIALNAEQIKFPPNLTRLAFSPATTPFHRDSIPSTVTDLTLFCTSEARLTVSMMPLNLVAFHLVTANSIQISLIVDCDWPSTLETMEWDAVPRSNNIQVATPFLSDLPPSLKIITGFEELLHHTGRAGGGGNDAPRSLIATLPPLTKIHLSEPLSDQSISNLPTTLTSITSQFQNTPVWINKMQELTQLRHIGTGRQSQALPTEAFWKHMHDRLETLNCQLTDFETFDGLCGPWTRLQKLCLYVPKEFELSPKLGTSVEEYSSMLEMDKKLFRYPETLTTLHLFTSAYFSLFIHDMTYLTKMDDLRASARIPLDVRSEAIRSLKYDYPILPASLTELALCGPPSMVQSACKYLPNRLRNVMLQAFPFETNKRWKNKHLSNLPPSLTFLVVIGDNKFKSVEKILPKDLICLYNDKKVHL